MIYLGNDFEIKTEHRLHQFSDEIPKRYWSRGQVADKLNLTPTKVTFYRSLLFGALPKNTAGKFRKDFKYEQKHIDKIKRLLDLKEEGYTLRGSLKKMKHDK